LLNYIKTEYAGSSLNLKTWTYDYGSQFIVYDEGDSYWYNPDAISYDIGNLDALNPIVICFPVTCTLDGCSGHCVVALEEDYVDDIDDLEKLDHGPVYEPQNGEFLGYLGEQYIMCNEAISDCDKEKNHIFLIIGDDDLYIFEDGKWVGYDYYKDTLSSLKKQFN
jgi:hypothetical protein